MESQIRPHPFIVLNSVKLYVNLIVLNFYNVIYPSPVALHGKSVYIKVL